MLNNGKVLLLLLLLSSPGSSISLGILAHFVSSWYLSKHTHKQCGCAAQKKWCRATFNLNLSRFLYDPWELLYQFKSAAPTAIPRGKCVFSPRPHCWSTVQHHQKWRVFHLFPSNCRCCCCPYIHPTGRWRWRPNDLPVLVNFYLTPHRRLHGLLGELQRTTRCSL